MEFNKEQMNVVFVGHVDHGKSTVIGRLLADTNSLPKGKLEGIRARCAAQGVPFEYALLIDALKDEQAQSITIDSARVFFQSAQRNYIIIDAPGHIEFIKNMVTGASHAEAAILVIDAAEGVQENSRRHGYMLWMLGIKKIVVLVNKMDLVGYDQAVFERIQAEYAEYLRGIGVQPMYYIPVSGRDGAGVAAHNGQMSWYDGPTLLQALDSFEKARTLSDQPVRMPVQDVYKFSDMGDNRRIVAGTLSSGTLQPGDAVVFYPSAKRTVLKTLESFNTEPQSQVSAGQAVGFSMAEQIYVRRGQIACKVDEMPPAVSTRMRVSLFWLGRQPLSTDKTLILKLGTAREKAQIESIHRVIDASDYSAQNGNENLVIEHHDVAEVTLRLAHPIAFDTSDKLPDTSRFVLVDEYEIRGGGIVLEALPDEVSELRDEVNLRNQKWIRSHVTMEQRYEKYNQKSALVVITGPKGIGRKRLASLLERQLFEDGKLCYYLGIGSVLYGVNADLKRRDAINNWREHVRRFGELAHLFLDAGQILIVTAVEFTKSDLAILQTVIDEDSIKTVWLGEHVTTDLNVDLVFDHGESDEEMAIRIKRLLQDGGFIFRF
ncbi:MAG: adenylyl-sulfate kinase [Chloroflexi bacterium HGW-Chloroflexi-2]|nr:MAG: adenylyl-sulfate kinase [Chloroflexi bacterium HGW-Chloroflexi-2]